MEVSIRRGRDEDRDAILACVRAAYAHYVPRIGKEPAPMRADYATLIAEGVVHVIPGASGVRGIVVCFPKDDGFSSRTSPSIPRAKDRGSGEP